ncbi:MAG: hypothetical protein EXR35_08970 [Limnohabitans sp.]|nr:hypothetical protein [Limnohabitans sp.]
MNSYLIMQALIERNVIGDFRLGNGTVEEPDLMRFGFAPLYVGYEDIWHAVAILKNILETGEWQDVRFKKIKQVT